jgi:hypothetical protein
MMGIFRRAPRAGRGALRNQIFNCAAVFATAFVFYAAGAATAPGQGITLSGRWSIEALPEGGRLSVGLMRTTESGGKDNRYFKLSLEELQGLTREQVYSGGAKVRFQLRRRAGTLDFEGTFRGGKGSGDFTFAGDAGFVAQMERDGYGDAVRQNLIGFAIGDFETLEAQLAALGLERPTVDQLRSMSIHGVSATFVSELTAMGYKPRSIDQLISMRIHGASIDFIKSLAAAGYDRPTLDQLIAMRIHGVSLKFIEELKSLGYERVPLDDLISLRIHGVTPDFIRKLKAEGGGRVTLDQVLDVRAFGMPAEFINYVPEAAAGDKDAAHWLVKFRPGEQKGWLLWRDSTVNRRSYEIDAVELRGVSSGQLFSAGSRVSFTFQRAGKTLSCDGWFKEGYGAGVCRD